ncbi:MAG: hypothetical protein U0R66_16075 [Mycobacterium sp.]
MGTTSVDPQALRFAAQRLDEAADLLDVALRSHLSELRLRGPDPRTRSSIGQLVDGVSRWQRLAREYAYAVRAGADRYVDEDRRGAQVLG